MKRTKQKLIGKILQPVEAGFLVTFHIIESPSSTSFNAVEVKSEQSLFVDSQVKAMLIPMEASND